MILKIRTGWDSSGNELFQTIADVHSVTDHGLCDPYDISAEPCFYQLHDLRDDATQWIESKPPRVIRAVFRDFSEKTYAIVDGYLCNDSGAILGRYNGNWSVAQT